MSDHLEELLKQSIKRIIAEAIAEAAGQTGISAPKDPMPTSQQAQEFSIWREKLKFVSKSAACVAGAAFTCGIIGITLFAPELAQAAMNGDMYGHQYYALSLPNEQDQITRKVEEVSWRDLVSMDKVEEMLKKGAILHAAPDDLSAIVIFFFLRKLAKGEPINIKNLQNDFRDSLPDDWMPVYDAVVEEYPEHALPAQSPWFAPPKI